MMLRSAADTRYGRWRKGAWVPVSVTRAGGGGGERTLGLSAIFCLSRLPLQLLPWLQHCALIDVIHPVIRPPSVVAFPVPELQLDTRAAAAVAKGRLAYLLFFAYPGW
ncbi:hypothetical protein V5799_034032 [Amblyomma americanum]|uniref:Uncharacterized protein n=1 Tax=Amblyomma americanum TaxID=6943 RepID=A0AAQ4DLL9_AMBAM